MVFGQRRETQNKEYEKKLYAILKLFSQAAVQLQPIVGTTGQQSVRKKERYSNETKEEELLQRTQSGSREQMPRADA